MKTKEIKKLDKEWRELILLKAKNRCEFPGCTKDRYLNAHHIFTRKKMSVRFDLDNGLCLCPLHHTLGDMSAHNWIHFKDHIVENGVRTEEFLKDLEQKAWKPLKPDYEQTLKYLTNEKQKLC